MRPRIKVLRLNQTKDKVIGWAYLINISVQYNGATGSYSVFTNAIATTGFTVITMNNSSYYDCIFHFTVLND